MRISVVIATYNRPQLLEKLLEGLARQRGAGEFDVTVVDDGSAQPVEPLITRRPWPFALQVISQANTGPAKARHRGVQCSGGEIVVIVDDDMRIPEHFLAAHKRAHEAGADVVLGWIKPAADLHDKPIFERFHAAQLAKFVAATRAGQKVPGSALCTGNVSFRRADYERIGGFDESLGRSEDRDLGIRLQRAGARFTFSQEAYSEHESDHSEATVWKRRAFLYGVYDHKISQKFRDDFDSSPWSYLGLVHPLSRPVLLTVLSAVSAAPWLSEQVMRASERLDRAGLESLAIKGTTLVFGIEYFRGVRSEYPSGQAALSDYRRYIFARRRDRPANQNHEVAQAEGGAKLVARVRERLGI